MYRMIVTTQTIGTNGRPTSTVERIPHIPEHEVEARREAARRSAPLGATRTIRFVKEA